MSLMMSTVQQILLYNVQGSELHEPDDEYSLLLYRDLSSMSLMMSTASYCLLYRDLSSKSLKMSTASYCTGI